VAATRLDQGFSVVEKEEEKSPQSGKMEFAKTQIPKEVTNEGYHVGSGGYRCDRV
jgi:hypothetical protein